MSSLYSQTFIAWKPLLFSIIIISSFRECHMNGTIQYVTFLDWLLLLSINLWYSSKLLHVSFVSSFLLLSNILCMDVPQIVSPFTCIKDIWIVFQFELFWATMNRTAINTDNQVLYNVSFHSPGRNPRRGISGFRRNFWVYKKQKRSSRPR